MASKVVLDAWKSQRDALRYEIAEAKRALDVAHSEYRAAIPEYERLLHICGGKPLDPGWICAVAVFLGSPVLLGALVTDSWITWMLFFVYLAVALSAPRLQRARALKYAANLPSLELMERNTQYLAAEISALGRQIESARGDVATLTAAIESAALRSSGS